MDLDRKAAYAEKLKDPRWQRKRLEILNRDNWTCRLCGSKEKTLHVHHASYSPFPGVEPWDEYPWMLFTVCVDCHEDEHQSSREARYLVNAIIGLLGIVTSRELDLFSDLAVGKAKQLGGSISIMPHQERIGLVVDILRNLESSKSLAISDGTWYRNQ